MADITIPKTLKDLLGEQLPSDVPFTFYHYSTPPSKSSALFSAPPHGKSERTYCESHTLAASIIPKVTGPSELPEELLILAIEVLIYTTRSLTTIFVSKADSTGYLSELRLPRAQSASPLKAICGVFVAWLAKERQREGKKLVVSLFARAQDQYLFPASIENKNKHVLDDRALVKWWCKVLDPMIWQYQAEEEQRPFAKRLVGGESTRTNDMFSQSKITAKGYLVIPGFEPYDTLRYIPPPPKPTAPRRWVTTHPLLQIAPQPAAPPRCLVPHFPDDPKTRFLEELDEELPDRGTDAMVAEGGTPSRSNGQWKSVKSLDQFWEFMAFRQECSSGRIVGFIWVVLSPPKPSILEEDEDLPLQQSSQSIANIESQEKMPSLKRRKRNRRRREDKIKYGQIPLVLPKIKASSSNLSSTSNVSNNPGARLYAEASPYFVWPTSSRGTICFSTKNYNRAHEVLLQQSFANRRAAAQSTRKWKEEVGVLGGLEHWSWTVTGKNEISAADSTSKNESAPNIVMGVRRKRKPDTPVQPTSSLETPTGSVQVLSEGLVRKKVKLEAPCIAESTCPDGVNTLSAALVRKKSKA